MNPTQMTWFKSPCAIKIPLKMRQVANAGCQTHVVCIAAYFLLRERTGRNLTQIF